MIDIVKIAEVITAEYYKKELIGYLKYKLGTDKRWCLRALKVIFDKQTEDEKRNKVTRKLNNIGFSAYDAEILTDICLSYLKYDNVTDKQLAVCLKIMPKYAKQLLNFTRLDDLERIMDNDKAFQERRKKVEDKLEKHQNQIEQMLFNF